MNSGHFVKHFEARHDRFKFWPIGHRDRFLQIAAGAALRVGVTAGTRAGFAASASAGVFHERDFAGCWPFNTAIHREIRGEPPFRWLF